MDRRRERLGWWHRKYVFWPAVVIGLLVLLWLGGCASIDELRQHEELHCAGFGHQQPTNQIGPTFYEWHKARPASEKPWVYIYSDNPDADCRAIGAQAVGSRRIDACAQWCQANCIIILPK